MAAPGGIAQAIASHRDALHALPGVVGVAEGVTEGGVPCVLLLLSAEVQGSAASYPASIEGYPVRTRLTGPLRRRGFDAER